MSNIIKIIALLIAIAIAIGFYYRLNDNLPLGDRIIGISVLASTFILMPLFLYHRWKGKRLKDYTLSDENLKKMKERNKH
ncbi:hypothetical protein [Salinimicrobium flavum]|uniref:Uncharacterized protein n=1 Tax=Salinimicrobium flavum TaxID=1737065 RepID=A0ABW5IZK8_9FLAO